MSRKRNRPLSTLAVAAAVGAIAAPAASAATVEQFIPDAGDSRNDRPVPVRVVEAKTDRHFDWGDAGIGATGMLALAMIGAGAAAATGRRVRRLNPS